MLKYFLKNRKVSNYISSSKLRFNYHGRLMIIALVFFAPVLFYCTSVVNEMIQHIVFLTENDPLAASRLTSDAQHLLLIFTLSFFIYFCMSLVLVILLEQRVGGPTVAILQFIEQLKEGNFTYNRNLRKRDELVVILESLKELQDQLKDKPS